MKSIHGVLALVTTFAGLLVPVTAATVAPAHADAADYDPITTAKADDRADVTTPTSDLATATVKINPNVGAVTLDARLTTPPASYIRRAVIALGTTDDAGVCQTAAEIVASNASYDLVVRRPDEVTFPAEAHPPGGDIEGETYRSEPLVEGLVPDCGTVQLTNKRGAVLDTAELTFARTAIRQVTLTVRVPKGLQQQDRLTSTSTNPVSVGTGGYGWSSWAYDGTVTVDAPDAVKVELTAGDGDYCYGQTEPIFNESTASFCFDVTVLRGGVHTVRFTFDAGNADPVMTTVQFYAPGGPLPPATGDLTGRYFALFEKFGMTSAYSWGARGSMWFLDRHFVYIGAPLHGRPTCTAAKVDPAKFFGCQRYWWDKERNVLQVGRWRGSVHPRRINYISHPHHSDQSYRFPVGLAPRGKRFATTWRYTSDMDGLTKARLRLTRDGRFELTVNRRTSRGRYAVGTAGRLRLTYRSGRVVVHTFAIGRNQRGRLDPAAGVLLSLPNFNEGEIAWLRKVT